MAAMEDAGFEPDKVAYTALMKAYAEAFDPDSARRVFEAFVRAKGRDAADVLACNTLIRSYGRALRWREAFQVYDSMEHALGVRPNLLTFTNLAAAAIASNRPDKAVDVLTAAEDRCRPNEFFYTIKIRAHAKLADLRGAVDSLRAMRDRGIEPNALTVAALLEACIEADQPRAGQALARELRKQKRHVLSGLAAAAESSSSSSSSSSSLEQLKRHQHDEDHAGGEEDDGASPLAETVSFFSEAALDEDVVTNTLLLRCHLRAGDADEALQLLRNMRHPSSPRLSDSKRPKGRRWDPRPTIVTYNAALEGFLQLGYRDAALEALEGLAKAFSPNPNTWQALLAAPDDQFLPDFLHRAILLLARKRRPCLAELYEKFLVAQVAAGRRVSGPDDDDDLVAMRRGGSLQLLFLGATPEALHRHKMLRARLLRLERRLLAPSQDAAENYNNRADDADKLRRGETTAPSSS